jgi:hypothetical protein
MRQRTCALVALGIASALVLGVAGNADASLVSAPYGTDAIPGPQPRPMPRPQPAVVPAQVARPALSPAPGAPPQPRQAREGWARNSVVVAGI